MGGVERDAFDAGLRLTVEVEGFLEEGKFVAGVVVEGAGCQF